MAKAATRTRRNRTAAPAAESGGGRELLLRAALEAFFEHGFHGTSMRNIAERAGTAISHAYYYFPSKAEMLRTLMVGVIDDLIAALDQAAAEAGPDPAARLAAVVRAHVRFHTERQADSFVTNTELRSLSPETRDEIVAMRDRIAAFFKTAVDDGIRENLFRCRHRDEAVLAIVTMCTAVAGWYRADGPQTPQAVADHYAELVLNMLGYARPQ